ncbi:MAG: hypothetical protein RSF40_04885 [Oscillospiraceae bacterium]
MSKNNYTAKSGGKIAGAVSNAQAFRDKVTKPINDVTGQLRKIASIGFNAYKITLAEAGFWRQVFSFPRGAKSDKAKSVNGYENVRDRYEAKSAQPRTYDAGFECGDYTLPLSINYSISASKKTAESQLVDGVNIVERIAKSARVVTVSFSLERIPTEDYSIQNALSIKKNPPRSASIMSLSEPTPLYTLQSILSDLYENDEVFMISNRVLNNELGVKWAFIKDYTIVPNVGSTIFSVSMTLQEVNINDALLYTSVDNAPTYSEIPEKSGS